MSNSNLPTNSGNGKINPVDAAGNIFNLRKTALKPTQYSARVTRQNPCAVVILIDQSKSMGRSITNSYGETKSKAKAVSHVVNELFESLLMKCQKDNMIRDYFNFLVIGYGNNSNETNISIAWEGNLVDKEWVTVSDLKTNLLKREPYIKLETMAWGEVKEVKKTRKVWIEPRHDGDCTPMYGAFKLCKEKIEQWTNDNVESFPPLVFNITDGLPTDVQTLNSLVEICNEIKNISTSDGNTLLFNCLLTNTANKEILLPTLSERDLFEENKYQSALFDASSYLPKEMTNMAYQIYNDEKFLNDQIKGVILNSSLSSMVQLLNIGTNTALTKAND